MEKLAALQITIQKCCNRHCLRFREAKSNDSRFLGEGRYVLHILNRPAVRFLLDDRKLAVHGSTLFEFLQTMSLRGRVQRT
jgi:hypothetical protein